MNTTICLTTAQKKTLAKLCLSRASLKLVAHVFATPLGSWPETQQAKVQAIDALPNGVTLVDAMDAVQSAGLVPHIHPSRK